MPFSRQAFTGFPFDRDLDRNRDFDRNRDGSFRSKLDDIAKRHPEFAEHLQGFPTTRRSSTSRTEDPTEEYVRRFERPFGSRFERFGFPFDDDFDRGEPQRTHSPSYHQNYQAGSPPSYQHQGEPHSSYQHQSEPHTAQYSKSPPQYYQQPEPEPSGGSQQGEACSSESQPQEQTRGRTRNIQQSNTVDLGQKQEEPLNERNQRSMSAPPTENRQGQRYVSSINIPISREAGNGDNPNMGKQYSTHPQGNTNQSQGTTERVIPIHVEGRDDPVLPKNVSHQAHQQPQPERIFGQRPEQFTQFVREPRSGPFPSDWNHPTGFERHAFPEEEFVRKQHVPPHHQQFQQRTSSPHRPATPQNQQQYKPQEPPKAETPPPQDPKPQPPKQPLTPVEQIQAIQKDVSELLKQVEEFKGVPKDKQYLFLDEMLTRNLLKLDNIDTQGQDIIRSARKEAIKCIEKGIGALEARAAANVAPKQEEKMEVEQEQPKNDEVKSEEVKEETMETAEEKPAEQTMDVAPETEKTADVESEETKPEEPVETTTVEENAPVEENVVSVKDAISKIEENNQQKDAEEAKEQTEGNTDKDENGEKKEETSESAEVKDEAKPEEKKEKKKIKKKVTAGDKEKKQK